MQQYMYPSATWIQLHTNLLLSLSLLESKSFPLYKEKSNVSFKQKYVQIKIDIEYTS